MDKPKTRIYSIQAVESLGADTGAGNLVGVQPFMTPQDYATSERFYSKLDGYMAAAANEGWLNEKTIVIFPEYIGTWLVVLEMHASIYAAETLDAGIRSVILRVAPRLIFTIPKAKGSDKIRDSLFRMKGERMAQVYQETFSRLARLYQVTIVGGSIILPRPAVNEGALEVSSGPLQNISGVFKQDGGIEPELVRKVYIVEDEAPFVSGGEFEELPVYETPAGRLAVLICADSWYPRCYEALTEKQPELFAIPNNETPPWDSKWGGYNPGPPPADVNSADVGSLQNRDAWLKYALGGRLVNSGAHAGMHTFFHGAMWDMTGYGQGIVVTQDGIHLGSNVERAALLNYWLD